MKKFIKYLIATLAGLVFVLAVLLLNNFFALGEPILMLYHLSNSFFGVGIIMVLVTLLCWISSDGLFDGLTYALKRTFYLLTFRGAKVEEKFYDYKMRVSEKRISGYWFLAFVGLGFLTVAGIFLIFYYTNGGTEAYKAALGIA